MGGRGASSGGMSKSGKASVSAVSGSKKAATVMSKNADILSSAGNNNSALKAVKDLPIERADDRSAVINGRRWRDYGIGGLASQIRMNSAYITKQGKEWVGSVEFDGMIRNTKTFKSKSIDSVIRAVDQELDRRKV